MDRSRSIELLNKGVADELQAVQLYMYWHSHLADQGLGPLSLLFKRIAIMEIGHVEAKVIDEKGHYDEFDQQLENIKRFGLSYLALQSFGAGDAPAP